MNVNGAIELLAIVGLVFLVIGGVVYVTTRTAQAPKILVTLGVALFLVAAALQALAARSLAAVLGGLIILVGLALLLAAGLFNRLIRPLQGVKTDSRWVIAGSALVAIGALLIFLT